MHLQKIKNLPHKIKREFGKIPLVHSINDWAYQKALDDRAPFLPQLETRDRLIVDTIRQEGTCILPVDELALPTTSKMMASAFALANRLVGVPLASTSVVSEVGSAKEDLREFFEILSWALEPRLLDMVENYIGLPILYQGFAVRRSIADGLYTGVRRWHVDWEDRQLIKIIIYLNDVGEGGGAYEYISRPKTQQAIADLSYYNLGYLSDMEMARSVPIQDWTTCLAKMSSAIITDTSNVFHRAQPPTDRERFSIAFCYTSTSPKVIWRSRKSSLQEWEEFANGLNDRQKNCLTKRRYG